MRLLKPGGLLCYIVTNKWMKAGYGEPLRRFFSEKAWVRSVVDFRMEELPIAEPTAVIREAAETAVRRLIEITSHQQQTQRTLLDWLRVEYGIEKPSNKLLALTELDSDTWVSEVKRIRGKKHPLTAAGLQALRQEYTRTLDPACALAAETLTLERTLSDLVNQAYDLTPAEIALMWQTAPPRMPILPIRLTRRDSLGRLRELHLAGRHSHEIGLSPPADSSSIAAPR